MLPELERLKQLLARLRELEDRMAQPHEQPILDVGRTALRDELSRLAHSLRDHSYWSSSHAPERRAS